MAKSPILPRNIEDPTAVDKLERGAINKFKSKLKQIGKEYPKLLDQLNARPVVNKRYTYQLDEYTLNSVIRQGDALISDILLEGGDDSQWFFEAYVKTAYARGTAQTFANLSNQSAVYHAANESLSNLISSEAYINRIALIRARSFEEMQGFTASIQADMARVLTDGIGRGLSPTEIAKSLSEQTGMEQYRANRIARTEIPTALRRARWDETESAQEKYGIKTMLMHISAWSPTTRHSHSERHGKLYTVDEVREWYSIGANSINCKCTQIEVMVDDKGEPLVPAIIERAKKMKPKSKG